MNNLNWLEFKLYSIDLKGKIKYARLHHTYTKKILHSKGNHQQNENLLSRRKYLQNIYLIGG